MKKIIFVLDEVDSNYDLFTIFKKYNISKSFSLNYHAHRIFEKNGIPHELADSLLTEEDKIFIDQNASLITTDWYNNPFIKNFLIFNNTELPELIEFELILYFLSVYRTAFSLYRVIEHEKPEMIVCSTSLNDFVKRICDEQKIELVTIDQKRKLLLQYDKINIKYNLSKFPISITISRKLYIKIKKISEKLTHLLLGVKQESILKSDKSILLLDFNAVQYNKLFFELSKLNRNILLLNQRRPTIWNFQSLQIIKKSKCKIIQLEFFESKNQIDEILNKFSKGLDDLFKRDDLFENTFLVKSNTIWYSIKDSFTEICKSRFKESVRRLILLENLFKEYNISVILEWAEISQEEKEVLYTAKKFGIPSIMLQHAMYPTSKIWDIFARFLLYFSHPCISDKQAVWGELTKQHALSLNHNNNLIVTGSPRHDVFFNSSSQRKIGKILLATTVISDYNTCYSTTDYYIKFEKFVKEVCRVIKSIPGKELIVKPHPVANFLNNVIEIIREIDPKIPITHTSNIKELIEQCELVITFNNSTIALESIILGVPTITLQVEEWTNDIDIVNQGAILAISDINEIETGIKKILYDKNYINQLHENSKKFVKKYMSNTGSASVTLAKILNEF